MILPALLLLALPAIAAAEPWTYYIGPCKDAQTGCRPGDPQLAEWALQAWSKAVNGRLVWTRVSDPSKARLRFHWATVREGQYGETRQARLHGRTVADLMVLTDVTQLHPGVTKIAQEDSLYRDSIIFLTCLHETGHALGLTHTTAYDDVMYSFASGGDMTEYFGRFRRALSGRHDIPKAPAVSRSDRNRLLAILQGTK